MFLAPGSVDPSAQIFNNATGQATVQLIFLFLLIISVPVMLCVKPCIIKSRMNRRAFSHSLLTDEQQSASAGGEIQMPTLNEARDEDQKHDGDVDEERGAQQEAAHGSGGGHGGGHDDEHRSFGDILIHQLIHTIEYVLGTISNTASYLRLWALSLAHSELSEVFYSKTLKSTLASSGAEGVLLNVAATFLFLLFTLGVLLVMDVMECFLHALRLHWVEFQNKFYYADGRAFQPFSFAQLVSKKQK